MHPMAALLPPAGSQNTAIDSADSGPVVADTARHSSFERALRGVHWRGWRLRALVAAALAGCVALLLLSRALAALPGLPVTLTTIAVRCC